MKSFCQSGRCGFLRCSAVVVLVAGVLYLAGFSRRAAEAQDRPPPASPPAADPFIPAASTPTTPPVPTLESQTVGQLLDSLNRTRSQRAELEKQEQKIVAIIKERIKQQRQALAELEAKLRQLGITMDEDRERGAISLPPGVTDLPPERKP